MSDGRKVMVLFVLGPIICLQIALLVGIIRSAPYEAAWYQSQKDFVAASNTNDPIGRQKAIALGKAALCGEDHTKWYLGNVSRICDDNITSGSKPR